MSLTDLSDIKAFLQITTTASDAVLTVYQSLVEAEMEAYTKQALVSNTFSEPLRYNVSNFDASNFIPFNTRVTQPQFVLKNTLNVSDLTIVYDSTTTVTDYTLNNGIVTMYSAQSDYKNKLVASYTSGYTTASCPTDLKAVVYLGVKSYFENGGTAKEGAGKVTSKSIDDFSVSYGSNPNSFLTAEGMKTYIASNKTILDKYRRIAI